MKLVSRLKLTAESWFDTLTEEQKKAYIEEHPTSKYSKNYKQADKSSTYKGGISALIEDNKKIDDEIRRLMSYYTMETDNNKKMNFLYKIEKLKSQREHNYATIEQFQDELNKLKVTSGIKIESAGNYGFYTFEEECEVYPELENIIENFIRNLELEDPTAAKEIGKYCKGYLKNKKSFLGKKAKELLPGLKKRAKTDPAAVEMIKTVEGYIRELKL